LFVHDVVLTGFLANAAIVIENGAAAKQARRGAVQL
jgi:hypothetical protein